jgi:hypothetical protein
VPGSGNLLVATGNGPWDGVSSWGDSVLELSPDGTSLLANWTPANELELDSLDLDLGSSAPAVLTSRLAAQVGKDGILRLLDLQRLNGHVFQAGAFKGGELQTIATRGAGQGFYSWMQTVWKGAGKTWLYTADFYGVDAYVLRGGRLQLAWRSFGTGGNPVVAGGLLYVTDWDQGGLVVLDPQTGEYLLKLPGSRGHWGSPVITDGRIAFPEGNANDHLLRGILNIYRLP